MGKKITRPNYYKEGHTYYCELRDGNDKYIGTATCCSEDYDVESEKVGYTIAEGRALIKAFQGARRMTRIELKALQKLYNRIRYSKHFQENYHPYSKIIDEIEEKKELILIWTNSIEQTKKDIRDYINAQDSVSKKIRAKRK